MGAFEYGAGPLPVLPNVYVHPVQGSPSAPGTFDMPKDTVSAGTAIAAGGTVAVAGGTYAEAGTYDEPATWKAVAGDVRIE